MKNITIASLFMTVAASAMAQCSVDIPEDTVTVHHGYEPLSCTQLTAIGSGEGELAYSWTNGSTLASVTLCDTASTWHFVTMTDSSGCQWTDSVLVNVVDVRCGENNNKVNVCHIPPGDHANAHGICISASGVPAHLAHGCTLGPCEATDEDGLDMEIGPNPINEQATVTVSSTTSQVVELAIVDATGRQIGLLFNGTLAGGSPRTFLLSTGDLVGEPRMVWLRLKGKEQSLVKSAVIVR
jgi:hypothetical protein